MSLKFSKTRGIDSSFRNMLIKRTEQIIDHIKKLKLELNEPETIKHKESIVEEDDQIVEDIEMIQSNKENINFLGSKKEENVEDEGINDIPEGFVEIQASKDFNIITPHEELDMAIFQNNKPVVLTEDTNTSKIEKENELSETGKTTICFACGYDKNPPNAKSCKNCNVDLK